LEYRRGDTHCAASYSFMLSAGVVAREGGAFPTRLAAGAVGPPTTLVSGSRAGAGACGAGAAIGAGAVIGAGAAIGAGATSAGGIAPPDAEGTAGGED
jgi:hypothetical protein